MIRCILMMTLSMISGCCTLFPRRCDTCQRAFLPSITSYSVKPNRVTPRGVQVDAGSFDIDLVKLDQAIDWMESCLANVGKEMIVPTVEERYLWSCVYDDFRNLHVNRECLKIKIVPAVTSTCSSWQFLDVKADQALCDRKGLVANKDCPCRWRMAIQDDQVVVTPPAIYLWDLGRIVTGCSNINGYATPFSKCLSASPEGIYKIH